MACGAALAVAFTSLALLWGPVAPANAAALVPYSDCSALAEDLRRELAKSVVDGYMFGAGTTSEASRVRGFDAPSDNLAFTSALPQTGDSGSTYAEVGQGPTGTNLQEAAVDEPDTAKLSDGRLVVLSQGQLNVLSAGREPRLLGSLRIEPSTVEWESSTPSERAEAVRDGYDIGIANGATSFMLFGDRAVVVAAGSRPVAPAPRVPTPAPTTTVPSPVPVPTVPASTPPAPSPPGTGDPAAPSLTPVPSSPSATDPVPAPTSPDSPEVEQQALAAPVLDEDGPISGSVDERGFRPAAPTVRLVLVDLSTGTPRILEDREQDGEFVDARVVNDRLHLVIRSTPAVAVPAFTDDTTDGLPARDRLLRGLARQVPLADLVPWVTRTAAGGELLEAGQAVNCAEVSRPENGTGSGLLTVTTLEPKRDLADVGSQSVVTYGDTVYASEERLVVATAPWFAPMGDLALESGVDDDATTELHTFDLSAGSPRYIASGSVKGYLLNRWALSWHEGVLRAAATSEPEWSVPEDGRPSESRVVKLIERGSDLVEVGSVEGLGKTERITAVRYFGDVAVVITFRQTDPLYVVDLSGAPKVTGELKITGFSSYLHPLGNGKLLGIGVEATDEGVVTGHQASVFDLSDPTAPTLVDRLALSSNNADLPVVDDSRAFAYDPTTRTAYVPLNQWDLGFEASIESKSGGFVRSFTISEEGRFTARPDIAVTKELYSARVLVDEDVVHATSDAVVVTVDRASGEALSTVSLPAASTTVP
jgi:uncharacterized secreted protein with C-terminal beta-propeller domain